VTRTFGDVIQEMLNDTCLSGYIGVGKDSHGLTQFKGTLSQSKAVFPNFVHDTISIS